MFKSLNRLKIFIVKFKIKLVLYYLKIKRGKRGGWINVPFRYNLYREFCGTEQNVILNEIINSLILSINKK